MTFDIHILSCPHCDEGEIDIFKERRTDIKVVQPPYTFHYFIRANGICSSCFKEWNIKIELDEVKT